MKSISPNSSTLREILAQIKEKAKSLGFQGCGVSDIDLQEAENHLQNWLQAGFQGEMDYMSKHGKKRTRPAELEPGTLSVISVRMDYIPPNAKDAWEVIHSSQNAFISRYSLGRDYHKVLRKRLQLLADFIETLIGPYQYRVFVDSAPVMEKAIAEKAGLGWIGKHSNLIHKNTGSWFFLGEIYTDLALPTDERSQFHCGDCSACISACPTDAIVAPFKVDARRCISYLTIEHKGHIPEQFRTAMGNRIYGCDDCQLVCPWNKFSEDSTELDFKIRHSLDDISLLELFSWDEQTFLKKTEGSAIRRIGFERWQRNIIIALGNAEFSQKTYTALVLRKTTASDLLLEHINWAIAQLNQRKFSQKN